jgi:hypothetical protein
MTEQYQVETRRPVFRTRFRSNPAHHIAPEQQTSSVQRLMADIDREIGHLDASIVAEEGRTGVSDMRDFKYSLVARQMRSRRDNLVSTKAALLSRLAHA